MLSSLPRSPFLYPILDAEHSTNLLVDAQDVIRAGAKILQIRAKKEGKRRLYGITQEITALCGEERVCCIVNDCVDIALITDASGVHLGQLDFPVTEARSLLPGKIIGVSTHNSDQFAEAGRQPVDYIAIGPVFQTTTKTNADPALGLSAVLSILKKKTKPVVAIGGIRREHIAQLLAAGVDGIALISEVYRSGAVYENVSRMMEKIRSHEEV